MSFILVMIIFWALYQSLTQNLSYNENAKNAHPCYRRVVQEEL